MSVSFPFFNLFIFSIISEGQQGALFNCYSDLCAILTQTQRENWFCTAQKKKIRLSLKNNVSLTVGTGLRSEYVCSVVFGGPGKHYFHYSYVVCPASCHFGHFFFFPPPLILQKMQAIFTFKSPEDPSECSIPSERSFFHWNGTFLIATCEYHREQKILLNAWAITHVYHSSAPFSWSLAVVRAKTNMPCPLAGRNRNPDVSRDTAFSNTCANVHAAGFCQNHKRPNLSFNALNIPLLHLLDDSP